MGRKVQGKNDCRSVTQLRHQLGTNIVSCRTRSHVVSCDGLSSHLLFALVQHAVMSLQQGFILCCYLIFRPSWLCIILEGACPASQCSINLCTNNFLLRPSIQGVWASDGESDIGTGRDVMTLRDGGSRSSLEEAKTMCC